MVQNKLPYKEFLHIFSKVPRCCVELIVETKEGIVFTKRKIKPYKGKWHLPGGSVLLNESLKQAVKRVAKEELNLNVELVRRLGVIEYFYGKKEKKHSISIVFLVKINSGKIKLDEQASEFKISRKSPPNLIKNHKEFIKSYLNKT